MIIFKFNEWKELTIYCPNDSVNENEIYEQLDAELVYNL